MQTKWMAIFCNQWQTNIKNHSLKKKFVEEYCKQSRPFSCWPTYTCWAKQARLAAVLLKKPQIIHTMAVEREYIKWLSVFCPPIQSTTSRQLKK